MQSFEFISKYFCNTFGTKKGEKNSLNVVSLLLGHQTQQRLYMLFIEPLLSVAIAEASCLNYVAWSTRHYYYYKLAVFTCHEASEFVCHMKNVSTRANFRETVVSRHKRDKTTPPRSSSGSLGDK